MRVAITTSVLRVPPTYFVVDHAQRMTAEHEFRVFALAAEVTDPSVSLAVTDFVPAPLPYRARMLLAPFALPAMGPAIRRYRPDLVHQHFATWCTPAVSATKALRVPLVTTLHGYDVFLANRTARTPLDRWQHHNIRRAREGSSRFLAVSEFLASVAVRAGFDSTKMRVHYQGVDSDYFTPSNADAGAGEAPVVLFVGSLGTNKGPRDLIDASRRLIGRVEHQLVLIGVGPLGAELAAETAGDPHIRFLGRLDRSGIREWMRRAAVHVLPTQEHKGWREAAGLVLLEAQACGTPVVAYASGGTPEMLIPDTTGILVPERDVASLASAIGTVLDMPQPEYERASRAARDFVRSRRSLSRSCEELAGHYASV